jgi:hypothetical protein
LDQVTASASKGIGQIMKYQGQTLYEWDGQYLSKYQGGRIFQVDGSVPVSVMALLASGFL